MDNFIEVDKEVGQKLLLAVQYEQLDVFKRLLNECQSVTWLSCKKKTELPDNVQSSFCSWSLLLEGLGIIVVHFGEYRSYCGAIPNYFSVGIMREIVKLSRGGIGVNATVKLQHKLKLCNFSTHKPTLSYVFLTVLRMIVLRDLHDFVGPLMDMDNASVKYTKEYLLNLYQHRTYSVVNNWNILFSFFQVSVVNF